MNLPTRIILVLLALPLAVLAQTTAPTTNLVTPLPPGVIALPCAAVVYWTAQQVNGSAATGYTVTRYVNGAASAQTFTVAGAQYSFADYGHDLPGGSLDPETAYSYTLTATGSGTATGTSIVSASVTPIRPTVGLLNAAAAPGATSLVVDYPVIKGLATLYNPLGVIGEIVTVTGRTGNADGTYTLTLAAATANAYVARSTLATSGAAFPSVSSSGVPMGISGDVRTAEALAPYAGALDTRGRWELAGNSTYDHIDFSANQVLIRAGISSITFNRCKFANVYFNGGLANDQIVFQDCTGSGGGAFFGMGTTIGLTNFVIRGCNLSGYNDSLDIGNVLGGSNNIRWNYFHDNVVVNGDHPDAIQFFYNTINNLSINWNNLSCVPQGGTPTYGYDLGNSCLQVGAMNAGATISNVDYSENRLDGGAYMFNANQIKAISASGYFQIMRNRVGPHVQYGYFKPFAAALHSGITNLLSDYSHNVYDGTGAPLPH